MVAVGACASVGSGVELGGIEEGVLSLGDAVEVVAGAVTGGTTVSAG